ncbi:MAG TPA: exosortase H [Usitatibacter sp.]|jgi:exosortase H (IPTLxxWG-CTERM-specific)|nr:exosortase H [Usitatibacter sp.]
MADARFAVRFAVILVLLFTAELTAPVQHALVEPWTAAVTHASQGLLDLFDPAVISFGNVLASTRSGFVVSIEAGCNGVEAALVLVAAILAFRAPWRPKALGIVVGLAAVQVLNVIRVVTLFYVGQWSARAFEWAHLYVWQTLIIIDVLVVWLLWMRWVGTRAAGAGGAGAGGAGA